MIQDADNREPRTGCSPARCQRTRRPQGGQNRSNGRFRERLNVRCWRKAVVRRP